MLLGALSAGALGAAFDQITVTLSPEYFTLGKGVGLEGAPLRLAAAWVGFRGGLPLGALAAGVALWTESRASRVRGLRLIAATALSVGPAALLGAPTMALLDPFGLRDASRGALASGEATRFLLCWGAHAGAYVGPIATLAIGAALAAAPRPR